MSDTITGAPSLDGWVLVPREATDRMTFLGQSVRYDSAWSIGAIYRHMLAAAPPSKAIAQAVAAARAEGRVAGLAEAVAVLRGRAKSASFMEAYLIRIIAGEVSTLLSPPTPAQIDTAPGGRADG